MGGSQTHYGTYKLDPYGVTEATTLYSLYGIMYTATFDFANGTKIERVVRVNNTVVYPGTPVRGGYTFSGWEPIIDVMPANDVTISAQWVSEYVKIVFGKKDLSEDEAENVFDQYTKESYKIIQVFADEETGNSVVIVKFVDAEKASEFVRNVHESSDKNGINEVIFTAFEVSFSPKLEIPFIFFLFQSIHIFKRIFLLIN